ncbi:heme o synthase [Nesterenkonia populi]|uniref:heme o synthase n=1 Tax=Nesterenkonia populi TaxID=1591087 RepID=UPI0011BEBA23|nr:heme o synthase [Nesterenkonia populi]
MTTTPSRTSADAPATLGFKRKAAAYWSLTKPRVIELLLVTTLPTMFFAQRGLPDFWTAVATMIGGAMAAGSAGAFNCYLDRDMDRLMNRTKKRPLVTGEVSPREALAFAAVLGALALGVLWVGTNPLATALGAAAIFFYVVVYTMLLKRRTEQNIIWGGIAGCFPVVIAWAAVRETLEWPALVLFVIIFLWTPPHYWPLSMKYRTDYQKADVPMLGAVATENTVSVQVVLYAWATVVCSLLLVPLGWAGITYTAVAVVSGAWFVWECHVLHRKAQQGSLKQKEAMKVFHLSILYLTLLFVGLWLDPFIGQPLMS